MISYNNRYKTGSLYKVTLEPVLYFATYGKPINTHNVVFVKTNTILMLVAVKESKMFTEYVDVIFVYDDKLIYRTVHYNGKLIDDGFEEIETI